MNLDVEVENFYIFQEFSNYLFNVKNIYLVFSFHLSFLIFRYGLTTIYFCFSDWVNENKTLQDEDHTKWKENGWKQLNMLKDYKIPNGADVVLTQYQKCRTLPRSPNGMIFLFTYTFKFFNHFKFYKKIMIKVLLDIIF